VKRAINRNFLDGSQRQWTTQTPACPPAKCRGESYTQRCLFPVLSILYTHTHTKPKTKLLWTARLQSLSPSCQRGVPALKQCCAWVSRRWLSGISRKNRPTARHGCGYPNIKGVLHLHMDNCAVMCFLTWRPDGNNRTHLQLPALSKSLHTLGG
jgi:hypothetical protein